MVMAAMVVLGVASYMQMSTELFPNVDFPFVIIRTIYPGASPDAVESDVTKNIEDEVNTISGIRRIYSYSREDVSLVFLEFELNVDPDIAAQDVRDKVSGILNDLPTDVEQPVIQKFDFSSQPVITLSISSDRSLKEITGFTKNFLKRRLETTPGVGSVQVIGGAEREIRVLLDLDKVNALGITPDQIAGAIQSSNLDLPGGKLYQGRNDIAVRVVGRAKSIEDLSNIIVMNKNGKIIRLGDIAEVIDGVEERESLSRYNGKENVSLALIRQTGANIVDVADGILARLDRLREQIPSDINVIVAFNDATFIKQSIEHVTFDLIYGSILATLVIFLFLANLRSTLIAGLAIPTSIIGTFFIMKLFGFTLNFMTLLGLSLAVGLLIDDAIVVIENIYRHLDEGKSPWQAARDATSQIGLAVMAATFTIVVVFLPVAFMSGIIGRFFYQFGITVAASVTISLFVAFTLTPMMSSRFLKKEEQIGAGKPGLIHLPGNILKSILRNWNKFFNNLNDLYRKILNWSLHHRFATLAIATIAFFASLAIGGLLGSEFFPQSDRSEFYVMFKAGPDASLERTGQMAKIIEDRVRKYPETVFTLTRTGGEDTPVNEGQVYVKLVPKDERSANAGEIITRARKDLADIAGLTIQVLTEKGDAGGQQQVEFSVRGPDFEEVKKLAEDVENLMRTAPGGRDFENSEKLARPEVQIHVERDRANDLGISIGALATTVRNLIDGYVVSRYKDQDEEYDIRLQLAPEYRTRMEDIERIKIFSTKQINDEDFLVELGNVASLDLAASPTQIKRFNRQREITVGCNLEEGYVTSDITQFMYKNIPNLNIPAGYDVAVVGTAEFMEESFQNIFMALVLSIIFIYLLLASQFESFVDPFSIMLSLPLAVVGALLTLFVWNATLNMMSLIGIVMLMGLVTKNAILLVDFTKQLRREGMSRTDAILRAGPIRLRPILMTSLATIFGMLPIALGLGTGTEFKSPMARAAIGGFLTSTVLTLVVVPVVYTVLDDIVAWITGRQTVKAEAVAVANPRDKVTGHSS
jgi:HAE1 family hydrophobic/amphiphilic exporter-1